jgi:hypothetical protein
MNYCRVSRKGSGVVFGRRVSHVDGRASTSLSSAICTQTSSSDARRPDESPADNQGSPPISDRDCHPVSEVRRHRFSDATSASVKSLKSLFALASRFAAATSSASCSSSKSSSSSNSRRRKEWPSFLGKPMLAVLAFRDCPGTFLTRTVGWGKRTAYNSVEGCHFTSEAISERNCCDVFDEKMQEAGQAGPAFPAG